MFIPSISFITTSCSFILICVCKVKEQLVVINDMDVNEHGRLSNFTHTQIKVKEQLVVINDMGDS
jgi:hypothetical protein